MTAPQLTQYVQGQGSVSADGLNTFMQTTNVVADLRNFVGVTGIEVSTRGLATVNDGGAGQYYWNATGTGPDDGINTIVPFGAAVGVWSRIGNSGAVVQAQLLLGGTGTYFTPVSARQLRVRMIAGGGGGSGSGSGGTQTDGADGQLTSFGTTTVNPGQGGAHGGRPGNGGKNGGGPALQRIGGQAGYWPVIFAAFPNYYSIGGSGGGTGSQVSSYTDPIGNPCLPNTGGGGQGGTFNSGSTFFDVFNSTPGFGGAEGEFAEVLINGPAATYAYSVGDGGAGGIGGGTGGGGGKGSNGYILVEAYF